VGAAVASVPAEAKSNRWGKDYFPNSPVVTQHGETLRFYDDLIKGKTVLISFIYTSCPDLCPLTTARLTQVEDKLGDMVGRDVFFYSITVDPENDSPAKLKAFAEAFHVGPGWLFLTGKPEDIRAINYKLGDRSRVLSEHRNEIVLGNDTTGEWTRNSVLGDLDRLAMDIRAMNPKWREQVPASATSEPAAYELSAQPGQALFRKLCSGCHTVGVGDRVGPDLRGVAERRDQAWLSKYIRRPQSLRAGKDPVALALAEQYKGVRMPNLGLSETDVADLISYLRTETSRLSADQGADGHNGDHQHEHHQHDNHQHDHH
jgi:cytochrome oxidase Cu insertion factor (SCO1/SenC/PrrC family)/cytochrome c2